MRSHVFDKRTFIPAAYCNDVYADFLDPDSEKYDEVMAFEF